MIQAHWRGFCVRRAVLREVSETLETLLSQLEDVRHTPSTPSPCGVVGRAVLCAQYLHRRGRLGRDTRTRLAAAGGEGVVV